MRFILAFLLLVAVAVLHLISPFPPLFEAWRIDPALGRMLLVELRLPRTLLALGYGATLGISGAALQALFANPLASPDITGSSSGAAMGAVLGSYWLGIASPLLLALCGAMGAGLALGLLVVLAGRRTDKVRMLLAGLAVSLAAGAATSLLLALAPSPFAFYDSFEWLMGSFTDRSLGQAGAALLPAAIACGLLLRRSRALDLMALGDDVLSSLGHPPRRIAFEIVALSSIAVGACVSVCGAIGFVGLIAPVVARRMVAGHPGRAMLPAGLIGAILLMLADLATRNVTLDHAIPVGVLTTLIGTPMFIAILLSMRGRMAS